MSSPLTPSPSGELIDLNQSYADFVLPGFQLDPRRIGHFSIALARAYSRLHNQRLNEAPFYGPWTILLNAVFDHLIPCMAVNPQYSFSSLRDETVDTSCDSAKPRDRRTQHLTNTRKKAVKDLKSALFGASDSESDGRSAFGGESASGGDDPGFTSDPESLEEASIVQDSAESTGQMVGKGKGKETVAAENKPKAPDTKPTPPRAATAANVQRVPDFVVELYPRVCSRADPDRVYPDFDIPHYTCWDEIKVPEVLVPSLWELKKPPSRSLPTERFFDELDKELAKAQKELLEECTLAFLNYPVLKSLILVAIAGEWWTWRIKQRPNLRELQTLLSSMPAESSKKYERGVKMNRPTSVERAMWTDTDAENPGEKGDLSYVDTGIPSDDSSIDFDQLEVTKSIRPVRACTGLSRETQPSSDAKLAASPPADSPPADALSPDSPPAGSSPRGSSPAHSPPVSLAPAVETSDEDDDRPFSDAPSEPEDIEEEEVDSVGENECGAGGEGAGVPEAQDEDGDDGAAGGSAEVSERQGEDRDDSADDDLPEPSVSRGFERHKDDAPTHDEPVQPDLKALQDFMTNLPAYSWPAPMRLGTDRSNQALALILSMHERLLQAAATGNISHGLSVTPERQSPVVSDVEENEPGPSKRPERRGRRQGRN